MQTRSNRWLLAAWLCVWCALCHSMKDSGFAYLPANPCLGGSVERAECCWKEAVTSIHKPPSLLTAGKSNRMREKADGKDWLPPHHADNL